MLIANPIYDTVFKYLMENLEIAKGMISTIIDEDIEYLDFKAQESIKKKNEGHPRLVAYHLDFIARIRQKNGTYKTVLIELQKTNIAYDIMRFRKYLGEEYRKEDEVIMLDGKILTDPLPIVTIYFLGFYLSKTLPAVIKVNRDYIDVLNGKQIKERNDFIECLTHDSFIIQIPALHLHLRNRLEYVLSIFMQENFIDTEHHLKDYAHQTEDALVKKILKRLEMAAADKELHHQLEVEELAEREYRNAVKKTAQEFEAKILEHQEVIREQEEALKEKDRALNEQKQYYEELLKKLGHTI
ncbi:MAG: hypothetical protein ACM3SY_21680 [Candidatus Omnitrophota bacterium]